MSSDNKRLVGVLAGGVLVAIVGIFLVSSLLKSKSSGNDKKAATGWASQWQAARECLVGKSPYAARGELAIEMREAFTPFIKDVLKRCVLLLEATRRPAGHTGSGADMEQLWIDAETAVKQLEEAVRVRLDGFHRKHISKIGKALDKADAQSARLAQAVGNPVATISGTDKDLPVLKTQALRWKNGRVLTTRPLRQVGAHLLAEVQNRGKKRERLFEVSGPANVSMTERALHTNYTPASGRWVPGIWVVKIEELEGDKTDPAAKKPAPKPAAPKPAAAVDPDAGLPEAPPPTHALVFKVADKEYVIAKVAETPAPLFHLAQADRHIVGYRLRIGLFVTESQDAGKTWTQRFASLGSGWRIDRLSWSRVLVVTSLAIPSYAVIDVKAAKPFGLPTGIADEPAPAFGGILSCYADKNTIWWLLRAGPRRTAVVRDVAGKMTVIAGGQALSRMSSCTADKMVGTGASASTGDAPVLVCTASACARAFNVRPNGAVNIGAVVAPKGEVVVAIHHHRILSVWRAGKRSYHRLRTKAKLRRLAVWGDKVYGVLVQDKKLRLVELTNVR